MEIPTLNQRVPGSSPGAPTNKIKGLLADLMSSQATQRVADPTRTLATAPTASCASFKIGSRRGRPEFSRAVRRASVGCGAELAVGFFEDRAAVALAASCAA